jgi:hypothetical protein
MLFSYGSGQQQIDGYLATAVGDNEIDDDKNEGESLAIAIAMAMQRYNVGRIADRARPGLHWKPLDAVIG